MPAEILIKDGTIILWAKAADYGSPGDLGTPTREIDLTSLGAGAAREGVKADLGATRADKYAVFAAIEYDVAPADGEICSFYFGQSPHATPGTANPGELTGADAAYAGSTGSNLDESLKQMSFVGAMPLVVEVAPTVQFMRVGTLFWPQRYVIPVVYNQSAQVLEGNATEMGVLLTPLIDESQ